MLEWKMFKGVLKYFKCWQYSYTPPELFSDYFISFRLYVPHTCFTLMFGLKNYSSCTLTYPLPLNMYHHVEQRLMSTSCVFYIFKRLYIDGILLSNSIT